MFDPIFRAADLTSAALKNTTTTSVNARTTNTAASHQGTRTSVLVAAGVLGTASEVRGSGMLPACANTLVGNVQDGMISLL